MDPYQSGLGNGDPDRPPLPMPRPNYQQYQSSYGDLLAGTESSYAANEPSVEELAQQMLELAGSVNAYPTSAGMQTGMSDHTLQLPAKRKYENHGFATGPQDPYNTNLHAYDASMQFPASAPVTSIPRPDPPAIPVVAKKPKLTSSLDPNSMFAAPGSAHPGPTLDSLLHGGRGSQYSFPAPGTDYQSRLMELQGHDPSTQMHAAGSHPNWSGHAPVMHHRPAESHITAEPQQPEIHNARGGIFDDADSEDESNDVMRPRQDPVVSRPTDPASSMPNAAEPPGNSGGGIFDDAEEELEFNPPLYASTEPKPKASSLLPKEEEEEKKKKKKTSPKSQTKKKASAPGAATEGTTTEKPEGTKKKKKPTKPVKRVLVARKERDLATAALAGKDDLVQVIDVDHCHFLGKELWIFTVQQLDCVLNGVDSSQTATDLTNQTASTEATSQATTEETKNTGEKGELRRQELVVRVAQSHLVSGTRKEDDSHTLAPNDPKSNESSVAKDPPPTEATTQGDANANAVASQPAENATGEQPTESGTSAGGDMTNGLATKSGAVTADQIANLLANLDQKDKASAEGLIQSWRSKIEDWKQIDPSQREVPNEQKFPLDGPIACLFPKGVLRFLASVPVPSLYGFLCLKKTETGAIIAYCAAWRKRCGLTEGAPLALAKHFLGMGLRVETAISSVPPPDAHTRKWMGDPLVVLTGAAREFLIDNRGLLCGREFIETRTKDLATALVEWRTTKGLPPLKGSGKVAMVSGWKANVKEAIDLDEGEGKVLRDINFQALVEEAEATPIVKEEKPKQGSGKPPMSQEFTFDPRIPDVDEALHSKEFLREVLDPKHFAVLEAAGIKTAVELFAAQKKDGSALAREVSKIVQDPNQFELAIFDWCQIVRKKLSGIRRVHTNKRKDPSPDAPETKTKAKKKEKPAAGARKVQQEKEKPEKKSKKEKKETTPRPDKQALLQKDIFYSLSAVTQTFLKTIGIETAEAFMASRTTDLSSAFVEFRAKNDMSVLKGLGAIASVSGWKAQVRKMASERGLHDLAHAAPPGTTGSPKAKPKPVSLLTNLESLTPLPPKKTAASPKAPLVAQKSKTVLSHPDVLFGRPSKKLVVESARDPRVRFYFEISVRRKRSDVALFISYIGARKLTTVNSDYSRIHQRNFTIVDDENGPADVSLLVAKDLSKKIKKDPNSSSAAGKDIRGPFSSLEDGCGLVELCKHDVWPLPREKEAEQIWPAIESFILQEERAEVAFDSNVVVGKDEKGRAQYFLFLKEPLERGQTVELQFCSPRPGTRPATVVPIDSQWRQNVEGMLSRLSRRGLRDLLTCVSKTVMEKIDRKICEILEEGKGPDHTQPKNLIVSRRRAHWIAFKVICQLQGQDTKGARTKSGGVDLSKELVHSYNVVAWTPQLVANLKAHPLWTESTVSAIQSEIREEFEAGIKSSEFLNASSRRRWCNLANGLFDVLLPRVEIFSGFLDPSVTEETMVTEIRDTSLMFARHLREGQGDNDTALGDLLLNFEEFTDDGMPCASPSLKHVLRTSVEQGYLDALALCNTSAVDIVAPRLQRVIATLTKSSEPKAAAVPEKSAKDAAKQKPEEASFRTYEDLKRGSATVHEAWYLRFQLLHVLNSLLSVSSILLEGGVSLKTVAVKAVESALLKAGVEELTKFDKSTVSVLAGTPVTFPSEVAASVYQPQPLPLFLGLVWPELRTTHWRVEAGDTPTDYSFVPPGQRGRRQRGDRRARQSAKKRTRERNKLAKACNDVGLGAVPKLTKRIFVSAVTTNSDEPKAGGQDAAPTVGEALELFLTKTKNEMGEDDSGSHKRAELVVKYIRDAFDTLADQDSTIESVDGKRPSDTAGCEHLARFVLIAPSILCQAQLSVQIVEDTTLLLKELASFLALEHKELFASHLCPPNEVYSGDAIQPPVLASKLAKPRSACDGASNEISEAILPEDIGQVTDFLELVMSQVTPCRATQEDTQKKNRKIRIGFVGLMCRHCEGNRGEGRYFFTSTESMTTAATVIEKHIQKCTMVAPDIKVRMAEYRSRHAEQRKVLGQGTQAAYYMRLWERLRSSKVRNTADASLQLMEMNDKQDDPDDDATPGSLEFESHVRVIEFIKDTQPWSEKQDVTEALRKYYESMELGGRLFKTDTMPRNFNSEWLLAKQIATTPKPDDPVPPPGTSTSKPEAKVLVKAKLQPKARSKPQAKPKTSKSKAKPSSSKPPTKS